MKLLTRSLLAILLAVLALPPIVSAATARTDGDVIVPPSQTSADDQYLAGNNVRIEGVVSGDVVAAARTVVVTGRVDGDLWTIGETVEVRGTVTGSVRTAASTVTITGMVGGDVITAGQTVDVAGTVARDVWAAGSDVRVAGTVGRDVKATGDRVVTAGRIGGNVTLDAGDRVDLQASTQIVGNLKYTAREQVKPAAGTVAGRTDFTQRSTQQNDDGFFDDVFGNLYWLAASLLLLVAILLYARRAAVLAADLVRTRPGVSFLIGLGSLILVPLGVVFLILSAVGIPLAVFTVFIYALVAYTAKLFPALLIGQLVLRRKKLDTFWAAFGAGALGLITFYVLNAVPVLGGLLSFAALTFGIGAQALLAFGIYKDNRKKYGV